MSQNRAPQLTKQATAERATRILRNLKCNWFDHITSQKIEWLEQLIKAGADPCAKTAHGESLLARATFNNSAPIISYLTRIGVDPNGGCGYWRKSTLLMYTARWNSIECTQALLDGGADRTVRVKGDTVADIARARGYYRIAQLLSRAEKIA